MAVRKNASILRLLLGTVFLTFYGASSIQLDVSGKDVVSQARNSGHAYFRTCSMTTGNIDCASCSSYIWRHFPTIQTQPSRGWFSPRMIYLLEGKALVHPTVDELRLQRLQLNSPQNNKEITIRCD